MSTRAWIHIAAIMIPVGVLTTSLGARSIGNTVELSTKSVRVEIPDSAELRAAGTMLMGIAASAQRMLRRRNGND